MPRKTFDAPWLANYGFDPRLEGFCHDMVVYRSEKASTGPATRAAMESTSDDDYPASADTIMVRLAIRRLDPDDREVIERYYYMGQSLSAIAEALGWDLARVDHRHRRALSKLRRMLEPWVKEGDPRALEDNCRICQSTYRDSIEQVIKSRSAKESYRRVLRILRTQFGIRLNHPRTIIHHQKYHMEGIVQ